MPMPPRTGRHPRLKNLVLATLALLLLASTPSAHAGKPQGTSAPTTGTLCATSTTSQVFAPWGDFNEYMLAPGGTFEGKNTSWTLSGVTRVNDNEPFKVAGSGIYSLHFPGPGARAVSPKFCVDETLPHIRFFAKELLPGAGNFHISLRYVNSFGQTVEQKADVLERGTHAAWSPTKDIALATALPIPAGGSIQAQLVLAVDPDGSGPWRVDDIYIDPYVRR